MAIDSKALNQLLFDAFTGQTSWLEASSRYPLEELIDTFRHTRTLMQKTVSDLTDAQAAYNAEGNATWSLSETITHLIYSQNGYHNFLLDLTSPDTPHITEAARGFGEGARQNVPADELRKSLDEATTRILEVIESTKTQSDPKRVIRNPLFGEMNYQTWMLLLLGHEVDHVRQSIVMRRLARAARP